MKSDVEIAHDAKMMDMDSVAEIAGIPSEYCELYGKNKAKVGLGLLDELRNRPDGKLILVTAITPTPAGEGKTTTTIGLGDALRRIGRRAVIALREPSLGPVFGVKGGAAGGGYSQVVPMEEINLHFTGDFHAVGAADNLLAAMIDNHIYQGNELNIDPAAITWRRCVDMNDRQLRHITSISNGPGGFSRGDGFEITVASELMAILCLSSSIRELKERIARIIVAVTFDGRPVTAGDLKAQGAMAALLKEAVNPNLVQTLEHTPVLIHGGPFANIAHGCNSLSATRLALKLGDFAVTEAGFGADLGAEKFIDIKCRIGGLRPSAAVVVATVRALKMHGGAAKSELGVENIDALRRGMANLLRHLSNIRDVFGLPAVAAINRFPTDTADELELVKAACEKNGVCAVVSDVWAHGGAGGVELAEKVVELCGGEPPEPGFAYDVNDGVAVKLETLVRRVYRGSGVDFSAEAERDINRIEKLGLGGLPVCVAKTPYSFSDDRNLIGAPEGFTVHFNSVRVSAGAGFIVALAGNIMTMPGLPKHPAAERIDIDDNGVITGVC
ncbi:MAG: formate--tetrahydrofolate ligase [Victivallaceae bacterium]|nr:formate--tetrahydrofolate ligase [Victivallaceae bacterium]